MVTEQFLGSESWRIKTLFMPKNRMLRSKVKIGKMHSNRCREAMHSSTQLRSNKSQYTSKVRMNPIFLGRFQVLARKLVIFDVKFVNWKMVIFYLLYFTMNR